VTAKEAAPAPGEAKRSLVRIRYGRGALALAIPGMRLAGVFRPGEHAAGARAGADPLADAVSGAASGIAEAVSGRRVSLLLADGTREEPRRELAAALAPLLRGARSILPVIATGSHDPGSPWQLRTAREARELLEGQGLPVREPYVHDPFDAERLDLGLTARGTPVRIAPRPMDADVLFVVSDMKPHYFAGYSCPPKYVFPGLAPLASIESNHAMTLEPASEGGRHPWHPDPGRRTNPLAADYCEAYGRAVGERPAFALAFGWSGDRVLWADAGPLREVTARGIAMVDRHCGVTVEPSRHVIVSPGGYPNDIDLYIGQRALELTSAAMADGADVLFLCACEEGAGPAHAVPAFIEPLHGDLERVAAGPEGPYRLYAHKAVRFARLILRLGSLGMHSTLAAGVLDGLPLTHEPDPQAVVDRWIARDPEARIMVLDGASRLSVVAA